jgi:hypothetical protein
MAWLPVRLHAQAVAGAGFQVLRYHVICYTLSHPPRYVKNPAACQEHPPHPTPQLTPSEQSGQGAAPAAAVCTQQLPQAHAHTGRGTLLLQKLAAWTPPMAGASLLPALPRYARCCCCWTALEATLCCSKVRWPPAAADDDDDQARGCDKPAPLLLLLLAGAAAAKWGRCQPRRLASCCRHAKLQPPLQGSCSCCYLQQSSATGVSRAPPVCSYPTGTLQPPLLDPACSSCLQLRTCGG